MTRALAASALALSLSAFTTPLASAQTLDVLTLPGGLDISINLNADTGNQDLVAGDQTLFSAPTITRDFIMTDSAGNPAAVVFFADGGEPGCAPRPWIVSTQFGMAWPQGPLGEECLPYLATGREGLISLTSPPDLAIDGDAILFTLEDGPIRLGPIVYAPQTGRGWDALDGEVGGYNDLSTLDLYAAEPVYDALTALWGDELFIYMQHILTRSLPFTEGNFLLQSGCLSAQCDFAIGLLAVDPGQEQVYSAFFNEGAPDIRPPLEEWSGPAQAIFDAWREGAYR